MSTRHVFCRAMGWEDQLESLRDEQDRRDAENKGLGKNLGARRPSDFDNPGFWGLIGLLLGGFLGRSLIGAIVGALLFGGGVFLLKRALTPDKNQPDRARLNRWRLLGAFVGVVGASVIGGVPLIPSLLLGAVVGHFIGKSRLARP